MAKKPNSSAKRAKNFDPERRYDVQLTRIVRVGGLKLLPRNQHQLTGAALNALVAEHGEDIVDATSAVE